jgi:PHD/YefM family antitoxin component YafN of YafNO toxin-antitoxin module
MIEERPAMTVREDVHQLIDALPEERLADVRDYIADLRDEDTTLSPETAAAIEEGLDDIRNGRTISLADYRRTRGL